MRKSKLITEQSEKIFTYGGVAIINILLFFVLLFIFIGKLPKAILIPVGLILVIVAYIFLDKTVRETSRLEDIKTIENLREIMGKLKRK